MTENLYTFSHRELVELMLKAADVHEGKWVLTVQLGVGTGNVGPSPTEVYPGVTIQFQKVGIQRLLEGAVEGTITIDAAVVNPPKSEPS